VPRGRVCLVGAARPCCVSAARRLMAERVPDSHRPPCDGGRGITYPAWAIAHRKSEQVRHAPYTRFNSASGPVEGHNGLACSPKLRRDI
jgi:hypothetical protein